MEQREALRRAAEQKWLDRNHSFKPTTFNLQETPFATPAVEVNNENASSLAALKDIGTRDPEVDAAGGGGRRGKTALSKADKQALAEPGGLVVEVSAL